MLHELGNFALILALCFAILQASALWEAPRSMVRRAVLGQWTFTLVAFFILVYCFIFNDLSVNYVAENSNTHLPLFYRITALWRAHEGSLLLWAVILGLWTVAVAFFSQKLEDDFRSRVLAVMGCLSTGFLLFIIFVSNPFNRLLPYSPLDGNDLNALLQDPGLAFHSPILYMGYAGFSVPFAFAISALLSGKMEADFAKWARPWTLLAWCFLSLGITAGSWWSYRELGWGGWWFWNPVEKASFMPWILGIALIHSLIVSEKRNSFHHWTILLSISTFSLSLLDTFLVRSSVLISVHAFAIDPSRGIFLLAFLLFVIGSALLLYALRANKIHSQHAFTWSSRENFLLLNNVLLFVAMSTVLLGTFYPLILEAFGEGKIAVGSSYFNRMFVPLTMLVLFCMGIGPLCHWGKTSWNTLKKPMLISFVISTIFAFWISLSVALAIFAIMAIVHRAWLTRKSPMSANRLGMWLAHAGIGVCVIGIAMSSLRYDKFFVCWIWAGGILIILGGLCSASSRKFWG